jgi:uncharacterized membrane-anchored protein
MIFILMFSTILIWLHISSLRFIIRTNQGNGTIEEVEKLEESIPDEEKDISLKSGPGILSLFVIILLNLIEVGYFIACVYIFNGLIVIISSSILAGYTFYTLFKFLPNIKRFFNKPSEYLKEKTEGAENIVSIVMTSFEILFCVYIFIRAIMDLGLF